MRGHVKKLVRAIFSDDSPKPEAFKVNDLALAANGSKLIEWASKYMPLLKSLKGKYFLEDPLGKAVIGCNINVTSENAVMVLMLKELGAKVAIASLPPSNDSVGASLVKEGIKVYMAEKDDQHEWCLDQVILNCPNIIIDHNLGLTNRLYEEHRGFLKNIILGTEDTESGIKSLEKMSKEDRLFYPVIDLTKLYSKWDAFGSSKVENELSALLKATPLSIAGKCLVVVGYGSHEAGVAAKARDLGAKIIFAVRDPIKAIKLEREGYDVMNIEVAASIGDFFAITPFSALTLDKRHFRKMKDGAVLLGAKGIERGIIMLEDLSSSMCSIGKNVTMYRVGSKNIYLVKDKPSASAKEGFPAEVADFGLYVLVSSLLSCFKKTESMENSVYNIAEWQFAEAIGLKLKAMNVCI